MLFLTARDGTEDKVRGLTLGGDELLPGQTVQPRRARGPGAGGTSPVGPRGARRAPALRGLGDGRRRGPCAACRNRVELSPTEYNLLRYLLINQGRVLSKPQILDHVWQYDFGGDGGVVETYIGYLRRKVDNVEPHLIYTIRGVGYTLRAS